MIEEEICNMSRDGSFTMSETNKLVRATNYKGLEGENEDNLNEGKIVGVGHWFVNCNYH
jgi:flagellar basal body rod protein FlgG